MAGELVARLDPAYQSGRTVTATVCNAAGAVVSSGIACPEVAATANYVGDFPGGQSAGVYFIKFVSGVLVYEDTIEWDGTARVTLASRLAASSYSAPPTAAAIRAEMDANSTKLANLDAAVSTRLASLGATAPAGWIDAAAVAASALNGKGDWATSSLDAAGVRAAVGLSSANLDTQFTGVPIGVWAANSRTLTSGSAPSAAANAAAVWGALVADYDVAGTMGAALADAGAAANPWEAQIRVNPGETPAVYVQAGTLVAALHVADGTPPVTPVPAAPTDPETARVYGYLESPDGALPAGVAVIFDLVPTTPLAGNRIASGRRIEAVTGANGQVTHVDAGGTVRDYVDLKQNDLLEPAGSYWTITCQPAGFSHLRFDLTAATVDAQGRFDLRQLVG